MKSTQQRYGNVLQLVGDLLHTVSNLKPGQIQQFIGKLAGWLEADDPLGFLHELENNQLLTILGEVAPVVAQWVSEGLGLGGPGGNRRRIGGRTTVASFAGLLTPASLERLGGLIASYLPTGYGPFFGGPGAAGGGGEISGGGSVPGSLADLQGYGGSNDTTQQDF